MCVFCGYNKHSKEDNITLRLIGKKEIILKISNQWKENNNFYLFKLSAPDQMKATDEKHIV